MAPSQPTPPLIKGYLAVRIRIPINYSSIGRQDDDDDEEEEEGGQNDYSWGDTFFYLKEHKGGGRVVDDEDKDNNQNDHDHHPHCTLFVVNAPEIPRILTRLLLKSILGRFGEVLRVTVVGNPRSSHHHHQQSSQQKGEHNPLLKWTHNNSFQAPPPPSFLWTTSIEGKFAHVVLKSPKHLKNTMKHLTRIMTSKDPFVLLDKVELDALAKETHRLQRIPTDDDNDNDDYDNSDDNNKNELRGLEAVAYRYHQSTALWKNNQALLQECNDIVQKWEEDADQLSQARKAAANQPDEDGFITVYNNNNTTAMAETSQELVTTTTPQQQQQHHQKKTPRRRSQKKPLGVGGGRPLEDFYRFQTKQYKKKSLQELRERFEEDLRQVKRLKEDKQYRPF